MDAADDTHNVLIKKNPKNCGSHNKQEKAEEVNTVVKLVIYDIHR